MLISEAKEILKENGFILEENQELNEGVLTIAAGVTLGLIALKVVGKVLGVGLKGLASVLTQSNHLAILKVIDRDKDVIASELKEYMMSDAEVSELIENKSITVKQIQEWIEKSSNKLIQPEFKANGLKMANNELHDRQLKSRGWKGGVSGGLKGHFDNYEKIREISSKLAQVVYDTIYEVKNESTICEGAYKDILHQKFAEKRAKREQDQKDYDARQRQMAKISKKLNKEIEEFISDLADEMVSDKVTCKYDKTGWRTFIQIENKQYKVDTYGFGVVEFAKYEYGRWNNIFNTKDLDNLDEFLEKVFDYITDAAA
jgi:hypothetical protein